MNINKFIDEHKNEMIDTLCEIVSIPSVEGDPVDNMPFGKSVNDALEYTLDYCRKLGFKVENFDNYAGHADFGDGAETLGVVLHLDVVPAGDGWTYDPFNPQLIDNRIYGRGTTDNKGPLVAILYAMKAIIDNDVKLNKRIRLIFGTNEETRWEGINYYLSKNKPPEFTLVPDGLFPMIYAEKGIVDYSLKKTIDCNYLSIVNFTGGNAINSVADECSILLKGDPKVNDSVMTNLKEHKVERSFNLKYESSKNEVLIKVNGKSAHASEPQRGSNAISYMAYVLVCVLPNDSKVYELMKFINESFGYADYYGKVGKFDFEDDPSGKLTNIIGTVEYKDSEVKYRLNARYPVTMDYTSWIEIVRNLAVDGGFSFEVEDHLVPVYQSLDSSESKTLINAYQSISGDYVSKPVSMGGGTYARALPNAITFGGQMQSDTVKPHQDDEYVTVEDMVMMTKIFAKAIYDLGTE